MKRQLFLLLMALMPMMIAAQDSLEIKSPFRSEMEFKEFMKINGSEIQYISQLESILRRSPSLIKDLDFRRRVQTLCAYKLYTNTTYGYLYEMKNILVKYPEIADAKDVIVTWDGSEKVNMKEAFLNHLRWYKEHNRLDRLFLYHSVYNDWSVFTEDERFNTEHNYILNISPQRLNEIYMEYFPDGQYAGKDFVEEGWAQAYIDNYKRVLKKNDPKLWVDRKDYSANDISYYDWLHYPRLSRGIGEMLKDTKLSTLMANLKKLPKNFMFNQRRLSILQGFFTSTDYVFKQYTASRDYADNFYSYAFSEVKKGSVLDEANLYRSLLDGIAASAQIDDDLCRYVGNTAVGENYLTWYACHQVADYLIDAVKAARTLSSSTPEIRPACKKAEEFIKSKLLMLRDKVFIYDDAWYEIMRKNVARYNEQVEADAQMLQEVENLGMPRYEYSGSWEEDYNDELYRSINFKDLTEMSSTKIWKAKNGSYYKTLVGAFLTAKYKTERDAIIAAYAYLKYNVIRQKGKI